MTHDEAKHLLIAHCNPMVAHGELLRAEEGFLPSLRPYRGHLIEKNFHQVMEDVFTVGETFHAAQVDREVIYSLWTICTWGRMWGLHPQGMLRRSYLIETAEIERLELWIEIIESTVHSLLGGMAPHLSINEYAQYVIDYGWWDNIDFFIPLMEGAIADTQYVPTVLLVRVLGRLGGRARSALPTLYRALKQQYSGPGVDIPLLELREETRRAIQSIEAASSSE
jgi:hypothetical protein